MHFTSQCRVILLPWNTRPVSPGPIIGSVPCMDHVNVSYFGRTQNVQQRGLFIDKNADRALIHNKIDLTGHRSITKCSTS